MYKRVLCLVLISLQKTFVLGGFTGGSGLRRLCIVEPLCLKAHAISEAYVYHGKRHKGGTHTSLKALNLYSLPARLAGSSCQHFRDYFRDYRR